MIAPTKQIVIEILCYESRFFSGPIIAYYESPNFTSKQSLRDTRKTNTQTEEHPARKESALLETHKEDPASIGTMGIFRPEEHTYTATATLLEYRRVHHC